MSFFSCSPCRHSEKSTLTVLLLSNFKKAVEKFGRVPHDKYNRLQGQKAVLYPPNLPLHPSCSFAMQNAKTQNLCLICLDFNGLQFCVLHLHFAKLLRFVGMGEGEKCA